MLFLMVSLTSRVGIKIGLFPTEFKPKSLLGKCQTMTRTFQTLHKKCLCARRTGFSKISYTHGVMSKLGREIMDFCQKSVIFAKNVKNHGFFGEAAMSKASAGL